MGWWWQLDSKESSDVITVRTAQIVLNKQCAGMGNPESDPHNRVTDIIPFQDVTTIMAYIYQHRND